MWTPSTGRRRRRYGLGGVNSGGERREAPLLIKLFIGSLERSSRAESETRRNFEERYFLVKLFGKEIYVPSGPNVDLLYG